MKFCNLSDLTEEEIKSAIRKGIAAYQEAIKNGGDARYVTVNNLVSFDAFEAIKPTTKLKDEYNSARWEVMWHNGDSHYFDDEKLFDRLFSEVSPLHQ